MIPHLRIARPTDHLEKISQMYCQGLGLDKLSAFKGHAGFDGIMLGLPELDWHIEFTHQPGHIVGGAPNQEHLLVLFIADDSEWNEACERMLAANFIQTPAYNPYWDENGRTFEDIEGYQVVLQKEPWRTQENE